METLRRSRNPTTGGSGPASFPNLRVCEHLFDFGVAHAGGEGRINVLPWYRQVGVASTSTETQGKKIGLPARVRGHHVIRG